MDEQDTKQSTALKKSVVSFHVYFDKQVHEKLERKSNKQKKKKKKKKKSLNFAESNAHRKTNARGALRHTIYFLA